MPPLYKYSVTSANYHFYRTGENYYSIKTETLICCAEIFFWQWWWCFSSIQVTELSLQLKLEIDEKYLRFITGIPSLLTTCIFDSLSFNLASYQSYSEML